MMTVPPDDEEEEKPTLNPLKDYTLASVCKLPDGWYVTLLNKKKRQDRIRLSPHTSHKNYKVISVEHEDRQEARVEIEAHGHRIYVQFERKFLAIAKTKPIKNSAQQEKKDYPPIPGSGSGTGRIRKIPVPPGP